MLKILTQHKDYVQRFVFIHMNIQIWYTLNGMLKILTQHKDYVQRFVFIHKNLSEE